MAVMAPVVKILVHGRKFFMQRKSQALAHWIVSGNAVRNGLSVLDDRSGTVYVVSVSGPKMYQSAKHPLMRRVAEDTQLYQTVEIDGDELIYRAYMVTGELYDAFNLTKGEKGTNKLQEKMPRRSKERRRAKTAE